MLTRVTLRNFKRFDDVEIELGDVVVFIGPNDSGKTTSLQALALWDIGVKRWNEKRGGKAAPEKRPGVTINRRDLIAIPVPDANSLWMDLHVRDVSRVEGKTRTQNVRMEMLVDGVSNGVAWRCGMEFDYANAESLYCRPLRIGTNGLERMPVPPEASEVKVAFLPPMSGLSANETRLDPGAINVRLGEGRTAEVLRNLCYQIANSDAGRWSEICARIRDQFGVALDTPLYNPDRGEIAMTYRTRSGIQLDLSSSGRGLLQTLLLLAHLAVNPGSVLLLDEPDAHLEILRQRQIYQLLTEAARERGSQIIAASHSEVILNEAADRDVVVAFLGKPHRIDDRGSQLLKSLKEIGFDHYYQAEQRGWVLYLEGSTDLAILRAFAETLGHPADSVLSRPFVHYVANQPQKARDHFYGLREAKKDLVGYALFDRVPATVLERPGLRERFWARREIENYLTTPETLNDWALAEGSRVEGNVFASNWTEAMSQAIQAVEAATETLGKGSPWSTDTKVSDDFLEPLFADFYKRLKLPNQMTKTNYHVLARFVPSDSIDPEVVAVLDEIVEVVARAIGLEA